jgi:type II secretion system protein G
MNTKRKAFTLIELLIVVAIIAILAAIAVPNFLEAQTRSKVARVMSDLRTTAIGLEAYRNDNPDYPSSGSGINYIQPYERRMRRLTTPVSFLSKVPGPSPFVPKPNDPDNDNPAATGNYEYYNKESVKAGNPDTYALNIWFGAAAKGAPLFPSDMNPPFDDGPEWLLKDRGPDMRWSWTGPGTAQEAAVFYDPTNGTVSIGEIYKSPMKSSFQ